MRRAIDPILGVLGILFGLPSLTYPFGRDQGLYYYVAREWVTRGSVPYRDVLDHKPPGIYILHALAILLFGEHMWGIRLLDLVCVVVIGMVAASLTARRSETIRPGMRGAGVLAASILYYGYFDFWNSAQSEIWYAMLAVSSICAALRFGSEKRAALVCGLLAGAAVVVKPPAVCLLLVAAVVLVQRTRRKALVPMALGLVLGASIVPGLVLGYFGTKSALPAMFDIVVGANAYYVKHEIGESMTNGFLIYHRACFPFVPALMLYLVSALVRARLRRDRGAFFRLVLAGGIVLSSYVAVVMQGKYYLLHWAVLVPAWSVVASNLARDLSELLEQRSRTLWFAPSIVVAFGGLWLATIEWSDGPSVWRRGVEHGWRFQTGRESRDVFTDNYDWPGVEFKRTTTEHVGNWLRDHTTPADSITVRGFEPQIYEVAQRRHQGRFFWTTFLTNPARAYRREEWLREDSDALAAHPPKYVVALTAIHAGPDSVEFFEARGYTTAVVMNELTIMEHRNP